MINLVGWVIFLGMFWYLVQKGIKIFEHYLKKRVEAQTDDELFKYMLDRHWESWAKTEGIEVRKKLQNKKTKVGARKNIFCEVDI
ncbi:MAG: hypothetical protein KBB52_05795 [Candidatus Omnitrophica bacterium]|nr:hypothetical protein [Candidatus Omnitrophota bacterium]